MTAKVLIVGNGPSKRNLEFIRNFDGIIITTDTATKSILDANITPDYMSMLEVTPKVMQDMAVNLMPRLGKTKFVYRREEVPRIIEAAKKYNVRLVPFEMPSYVNNAGLFSIVFAQKKLRTKEIHLIGFEHEGGKYPQHIYDSWVVEFNKYICTESEKDCKLIDHSNGRLTPIINSLNFLV